MIALRDHLPLILLPDGRSIAFEKNWLIRLLGVAADRAGATKWWMAEHVAASIEVWMLTLNEENQISSDDFVKGVREALNAVGYPRIGFHFARTAPFHRISLLEVAREVGLGFELGFFQRLEEKLRDVIKTGSTYCELHDLEYCVSYLCNRKSTSRQCEILRKEIVTFARCTTHLRSDSEESSPLFLYVA